MYHPGLPDDAICVHCSHNIGDHAAENDACPIQLANQANNWKNVFHTVFKFSRANSLSELKIIEKKSIECLCGIRRAACDYHKDDA